MRSLNPAICYFEKDLPSEFQLDELVETLIILEKIEIGLQQVKEGKTLSTEEAKEKLKKWIKLNWTIYFF